MYGKMQESRLSEIGRLICIFPDGSGGKESACNAGGLGLIPGLGTSPGGGNGNPLQYSYWENSMDRGAWWGKIHGVAKSQTQLKPLSIYLCKQVRINLNISIS